MTIIGLPPAGGWVTFNNIIKPTPKPTAKGMIKYRGSGTRYKKNKPTFQYWITGHKKRLFN